LADSAKRKDLAAVFRAFEEDRRSSRVSPVAATIRELRSILGDTQQQLAARADLAVGTIAQAETGRAPGRIVLQKLIRVAEDNDLPDLAGRLRQSLRSGDSDPDDGKRILLKNGFLDLIEKADTKQLHELENLLLDFGSPDETIYLLSGIKYLLSKEELKYGLRRALEFQRSASLKDILRQRALTDEESAFFGDLAQAAALKLEWEQKAETRELSLPEGIKELRLAVSMSEEELARHLGIGTEALKEMEQGRRRPGHTELMKLEELAVERGLGIQYFFSWLRGLRNMGPTWTTTLPIYWTMLTAGILE
jgi:transcriptional regulator with XRE-family HTH domain